MITLAAEWVHALRRKAAREVDPSQESGQAEFVPCERCEGKAAAFGGNPHCGICEGLGYVKPAEDDGPGKDMPPELIEAWPVMRDVLHCHQLIELHGVEGALFVLGGPNALGVGWHPVMIEAVNELAAELARLEHEDRKQEARAARAARAKHKREAARKNAG